MPGSRGRFEGFKGLDPCPLVGVRLQLYMSSSMLPRDDYDLTWHDRGTNAVSVPGHVASLISHHFLS